MIFIGYSVRLFSVAYLIYFPYCCEDIGYIVFAFLLIPTHKYIICSRWVFEFYILFKNKCCYIITRIGFVIVNPYTAVRLYLYFLSVLYYLCSRCWFIVFVWFFVINFLVGFLCKSISVSFRICSIYRRLWFNIPLAVFITVICCHTCWNINSCSTVDIPLTLFVKQSYIVRNIICTLIFPSTVYYFKGNFLLIFIGDSVRLFSVAYLIYFPYCCQFIFSVN